MNIFSPKHALWLAGFRPFFFLAMCAGAILPILWALVFSGKMTLPYGLNPMQWHAHEMLFGYAGAMLIGFLLTSSKNWVKVRGIHGVPLMLLAGLWISERFFIYFPSVDPIAKHIGLSLFILFSGGYIIWTLIKYHKNDFFKDNYFFIFLLCFILLAKNLLISSQYYQDGVAMSLGLFRLAFVVMFERTISQFMKNTQGVDLYRNPYLDYSIKGFVAFCIFQSFLPEPISAFLLTAAGLLLFLRWILWRPDFGFQKFGNGTMYFGYLGLTLHFFFEALKITNLWSYAAFSIHVFTFLCMGIVIPCMIIRIANGHTGRKPQFFLLEKIMIYALMASSIFRLILPVVWPVHYTVWIFIAGSIWTFSYIFLLFRVGIFLFRPRIDGKEH